MSLAWAIDACARKQLEDETYHPCGVRLRAHLDP